MYKYLSVRYRITTSVLNEAKIPVTFCYVSSGSKVGNLYCGEKKDQLMEGLYNFTKNDDLTFSCCNSGKFLTNFECICPPPLKKPRAGAELGQTHVKLGLNFTLIFCRFSFSRFGLIELLWWISFVQFIETIWFVIIFGICSLHFKHFER